MPVIAGNNLHFGDVGKLPVWVLRKCHTSDRDTVGARRGREPWFWTLTLDREGIRGHREGSGLWLQVVLRVLLPPPPTPPPPFRRPRVISLRDVLRPLA